MDDHVPAFRKVIVAEFGKGFVNQELNANELMDVFAALRSSQRPPPSTSTPTPQLRSTDPTNWMPLPEPSK